MDSILLDACLLKVCEDIDLIWKNLGIVKQSSKIKLSSTAGAKEVQEPVRQIIQTTFIEPALDFASIYPEQEEFSYINPMHHIYHSSLPIKKDIAVVEQEEFTTSEYETSFPVLLFSLVLAIASIAIISSTTANELDQSFSAFGSQWSAISIEKVLSVFQGQQSFLKECSSVSMTLSILDRPGLVIKIYDPGGRQYQRRTPTINNQQQRVINAGTFVSNRYFPYQHSGVDGSDSDYHSRQHFYIIHDCTGRSP